MFLVYTMDFNMDNKMELHDIMVEPMDFQDVHIPNSCDYDPSISQNLKTENLVKYFVYYLLSIIYTVFICW